MIATRLIGAAASKGCVKDGRGEQKLQARGQGGQAVLQTKCTCAGRFVCRNSDKCAYSVTIPPPGSSSHPPINPQPVLSSSSPAHTFGSCLQPASPTRPIPWFSLP